MRPARLQVVRHHDQARAALAIELEHQCEDARGIGAVEIAGGLVGQHDASAASPARAPPPRAAARRRRAGAAGASRRSPRPTRSSSAGAAPRAPRPPAYAAPAAAWRRSRAPRTPAAGDGTGRRSRAPGCAARRARSRSRRGCRARRPAPRRARSIEPAEDLQQRRLAGAGGADDRHALARRHARAPHRAAPAAPPAPGGSSCDRARFENRVTHDAAPPPAPCAPARQAG